MKIKNNDNLMMILRRSHSSFACLSFLLFFFVLDLLSERVVGYHFAMVSGFSPFFYPIEEGWNEECNELPGVTCEYWLDNITHWREEFDIDYNKTRDKRTCVPYIRYLIERGDVDGIATKCNVGIDDPPIIQEATDAGIPVVVFAGPHVGPYVSYVGTDNHETGRAMAKLLKQLRPEGGTYVVAYNGPSSLERNNGFVEEIEKDNDRDDRAHWQEVPNLNLTDLWWEVPDRDYHCCVGDTKLQKILDYNPTAVVMAYSTPFRHPNYIQVVERNGHKNVSYVGLEGASNELKFMTQGYIDGLVGQQTYQTGRKAARALYQIVTDGQDSVPSKFETKLINYNLMPDDLPDLVVDQNLLGNLKYTGLICFSIIVICVFGCIIWTTCNRNGIVVKASQPFFLVMTAAGVLIMAGAMIPLSMDDGGNRDIPESKAIGICMAVPWLAFLGFTVVFSALFAKTWRVNKFFKSKSNHARIRVSIKDVMGPFFVVFGLNTIILLCWTLIDPLKYQRTFSPGTDLFNRDLASTGLCRSENGAVAFLVPLGLINFVLLATACWQAVEARNIQCEFAEAGWIFLAVYSMLQAFLTGIPIVAVVKDIPEAFYLILTFLLFGICMAVLLLIFLPKILMQRKYAKMTPSEQINAMRVSVRLSSNQNPSPISGLRHNNIETFGSCSNPLQNPECEVAITPIPEGSSAAAASTTAIGSQGQPSTPVPSHVYYDNNTGEPARTVDDVASSSIRVESCTARSDDDPSISGSIAVRRIDGVDGVQSSYIEEEGEADALEAVSGE